MNLVPKGWRRIADGEMLEKGDRFYAGIHYFDNPDKPLALLVSYEETVMAGHPAGFDGCAEFYIRRVPKPRSAYFIAPAGYRRLKLGQRLRTGDLCFDEGSTRSRSSYRKTVFAGSVMGPGYCRRIYIRKISK